MILVLTIFMFNNVGIAENNWYQRADQTQDALEENYWNEDIKSYNLDSEEESREQFFHYWWHAHALDNLVDAYLRTKDSKYEEKIDTLYEGILQRNKGQITNDYYDDMLWMGLALLRAYQITEKEEYKDSVLELWEEIKGGWNDHCQGGIAWRKQQLDYKNTPANGPAVILAARLYREFGKKEYLEWAEKIFSWLDENLVDQNTGFVWDGKNREGKGKIDKDWQFTYNQGVYIGAAVELFKITEEINFLEKADKTADTAMVRLTLPGENIIQDEGQEDGGLFKGIYVRYLTKLIVTLAKTKTEQEFNYKEYIEHLEINAESAWEKSRNEKGIFNNDWTEKTDTKIDLSTNLSGVFLMEVMAVLEEKNLLNGGGIK